MNKILALVCFVLGSSVAFAGLAKHSEVDAKVVNQKNKNLMMKFEVTPKEGIKISPEAPWSLEITQNDIIKTSTLKHKLSSHTDKLATFELKAEKLKTGSVDYKLVAFICTSDKKSCYRDVHKGSLEIK